MLTISHYLVIGGLLLALLELAIGIEAGFDLVLIGSILLISGMLGIGTGSLMVSLVLASVLCVVYIVFGRRYVKHKLKSSPYASNTDRLLGESGKVIQAIDEDTAGRVKIHDEEWRARSEEHLPMGSKVRVVGIDGVTLNVVKK